MVLRGETDGAGDSVSACFQCAVCGAERSLPKERAIEVDGLQREGRQTCALLPGGRCHDTSGEEWATPRGERTSRRERAEPRVKREPAPSETGSSVEVTGFSQGALQFFKATTKYLKTPEYAGSTAELDFYAWQRGTERYFQTYGIHNEEERVTVAAALLTGDAASWWHSMWMSGRDQDVKDWEELKRLLRERFLPPEGEMNTVGRWKRCRQIGPVGKYSDFVYNLRALCPLGEKAEFKIVFHGLRPELQAELRKHMRQHNLSELPLARLFALATDAEVGLGQSGDRRKGEDGGRERGGREEGGEEKRSKGLHALRRATEITKEEGDDE